MKRRLRDMDDVRARLDALGIRHELYAGSGLAFPCPVCAGGKQDAAAEPLAGGGVYVHCSGCGDPDGIRGILLGEAVAPLGADVALGQVLDALCTFVRRYVVLSDRQAVAVTLWIAHTYAVEAAETTPYLAITSPEKRAGKSRLLDVLDEVVCKPWRAVLPSEAVVFRQVEAVQPTLLLDEVDAIWGKQAREHEGLRALLNAGWRRRGSTVPRCQPPTMKVVDYSTFCPKAVAGIGDLPDTIADRSIPVRMQRKHRGETVDRFRAREVAPEAERLREAASRTLGPLVAALTAARPALPDALDDRAQDGWEPLLAIADMAGDAWPAAAREAAVALTTGREVDAGDIAHQLLDDIRAVFAETGADRLASGELVEHLAAIPDSPWGDWNGSRVSGRRVAGWLRRYGVRPQHARAFRGYVLADLADAFDRYLSPPAPGNGAASVPSVPTPMVEPKTSVSEVSPNGAGGHLQNPEIPRNHAVGDTWDTSAADSGGQDGFTRVLDAICMLEAGGGVKGWDPAAEWHRAGQLDSADPRLGVIAARLEAWMAG